MATTIKRAPMLENTVIGSLRIRIEATTATTISDKSNIVEVEADRCFNPLSHKKYGITQQTIAVQKIAPQAQVSKEKKPGPARIEKGAIVRKVNMSTQVIDW
jgi:hypothetical protein